ncbi:MAG: hypothetical protein BroJett024_39680 [Alphaproteobacteria bacterium]|nr:MAG: hypothetical protein BroJett024_39680 [Alphaproteobacteria bacterium]
MAAQRSNPFLSKLRGGATAYGSFVFSIDPASTEILGACGFDLAIIDIEHAGMTLEHVYGHGRAAEAAGISWWVRVGTVEAAEVGRLLDAGAQGIIFPHFGLDPASRGEYAALVRYPPAGRRPTCTGIRAAGFGATSFPAYVERADRDVLAVGLIEDREVIEQADRTLADCEIDVVVPGGIGDLASSYGLHGQADHPVVTGAVERVLAAARKAGKKTGVYLSSVTAAATYASLAPDFYIYSIDYKVLAAAYAEIRRQLSGGPPRD